MTPAEKTQAVVSLARRLLPKVEPFLKTQPHPNRHYAGKGATLLDYVNWHFEDAKGNPGAAARIILKAAKGLVSDGQQRPDDPAGTAGLAQANQATRDDC